MSHKTNNKQLKLACITCNLEFGDNRDRFVDHMIDEHPEDAIQCTFCSEILSSGAEFAMHMVNAHLDEQPCASSSFQQNTFASSSGFRTRGSDTNRVTPFSDQANGAVGPGSVHRRSLYDEADRSGACPVCSLSFPLQYLDSHVNSHFDGCSDMSHTSHASNGESSDYVFAMELDRQEREAAREEESASFEQLRREYGMDESGGYKQQALQALERSYGKGQITLGQMYDARQRLAMNETLGVEDPNYSTKNIIGRIGELSRRCEDVLDVYLCTAVDHFSSSPADVGFGCGYRNIQMLLSSLKHCEAYKKALWGNDSVRVFSIPKIQSLIENAWEKGFDARGRAQLNGTLRNTRKWIGATEAAVFFEYFRISVEMVDIHATTDTKPRHPLMLRWCYDYFRDGSRSAFLPPLYFQHEGHSRTIVGVERTRSGQFCLLVFDPSHPRQRMRRLCNASDPNELKFLRKTSADLTKSNYQIVAVRGLIPSEEQYEWFKTNFYQTRIPPAK